MRASVQEGLLTQRISGLKTDCILATMSIHPLVTALLAI